MCVCVCAFAPVCVCSLEKQTTCVVFIEKIIQNCLRHRVLVRKSERPQLEHPTVAFAYGIYVYESKKKNNTHTEQKISFHHQIGSGKSNVHE